MTFDIRETPAETAAVIIALREGLGVEDMQARGVATAEYARLVVSRLRKHGLLATIYRDVRRVLVRQE